MLLSLDQRKILLGVLASLYQEREDLRTFLRDKLLKNLDEISTGGTLVDDRSRVVANAERFEWTVNLIEELRAVAGPNIQAQLALLGTDEEIKEARFYDECYVDRYPMVNRKTLREKLRRIATDNGKRVLLLEGNRHWGNSHALRHVRYIASQLEIPLVEFPLARYATGDDLQPSELGAQIAQVLNLELPHLDPKASRWSLNFIAWLQSKVKSTDRLWIAFDDFEKDKLRFALSDSIYEFVQLLCDSVANRLLSARLFLINYDRAIPQELNFQIDREKVPQISEDDILDFFLEFYRNHMQFTDDDVAARDAAKRAHAVALTLEADEALRLDQMREALRLQCEDMQGN